MTFSPPSLNSSAHLTVHQGTPTQLYTHPPTIYIHHPHTHPLRQPVYLRNHPPTEVSSQEAQVNSTKLVGNVLIFTLGGKCKPSGSTAADMEDYLPDSEDLISQPQSHSKRGRKKPVIKKSQGEPSQQVQLHYKVVFNLFWFFILFFHT